MHWLLIREDAFLFPLEAVSCMFVAERKVQEGKRPMQAPGLCGGPAGLGRERRVVRGTAGWAGRLGGEGAGEFMLKGEPERPWTQREGGDGRGPPESDPGLTGRCSWASRGTWTAPCGLWLPIQRRPASLAARSRDARRVSRGAGCGSVSTRVGSGQGGRPKSRFLAGSSQERRG